MFTCLSKDICVIETAILQDYKMVKPSRVQALGENGVDKYQAAVSQEIGVAYDIAVATLCGDI